MIFTSISVGIRRFISQDLAMVRKVCTRIAVMYLGEMVEIADNRELFFDPQHPYTKALLSAAPTLEDKLCSILAISCSSESRPARSTFRPAATLRHAVPRRSAAAALKLRTWSSRLPVA
jgi:ABC-type oligopeptide transport system ATPase subunit